MKVSASRNSKAAPGRGGKGTSTSAEIPANVANASAGANRTKTAKPQGNGASISDQDRRNHIEVAAYYIAQRRGFQGGSELEDWAQAELEVDRMLRKGRSEPPLQPLSRPLRASRNR